MLKPAASKKQISIPSWSIELVKGAAYICIAVGWVYLRLNAIEIHQKETDAAGVKLEAATTLEIGELRSKVTAQGDAVIALRERVNTLEVRAVLLDKSINEGLVRIEKAIDHLQTDVKEIQAKK